MRQTLTTFTLALCTASASNATDRVVSPNGTFNTISSAIAASSDGDRILVQSGTYNENIALNKSLSILPLVEGSRYTVVGSGAVAMTNGGRVLISGISLLLLGTSFAHTVRTDITVVDSYIGACEAIDPYVRIELYRDTIYDNISVASCSLIGNYVRGNDNNGASILVQGPSMLPDENLLIGNSIGAPTGGTGINLQGNTVFHVENNFVRTSPSGGPAVRINRTGALAALPSSILNNTFYKHINQAAAIVSNDGMAYYNLVVKNNAIIGYSNGLGALVPNWTGLTTSHNPIVAASAISVLTGQPSNGSPLINAGDPDPRYLDLDLTTNDVGCYGGSNSRANFITAMGSAVVGFMQAPRVVAQGDAVSISATGFDR